MRLIVGLGNPGVRYERTRHNLGFMVADQIARTLGAQFEKEQHHATTATASWRGRRALLAKPLTFMNRSGEAVRPLAHYYKIEPADILVVYDDLALPPGRLRMRRSGSAGGHNGVRSIIDCLGVESFARLRIGIGPVPPKWSGADYVLAALDADEWAEASHWVERAAEAALLWLEDGVDTAMRATNGSA